ncbi:diguanylate cyclase (GGDEF)-like protein [Nocardia tenerifensis]|uniref:Diguanylate cyclase (GGDEF)-like protein n=1 Tax=Nocardia tenerifensis TaxID=228006 RepID=A0A318KHR5_9NOCA|nr:GGDEF domain-containing protein [Nocardia tenerifensis]PXX60207.1 diguanylate cyclase (GGDEF)-like protein [Nocardia tenerifensis]
MSERVTAHRREHYAVVHAYLRLLRDWWRDGVDYRWVVNALAERSALAVVKFAIGLCGLATPLISVLIVTSSAGPQSVFGRTVLWCIVAASVLWVVRWWGLPWPSRVESLTLLAIGDVCITLVCVLSPGNVVRSVGMMLLLIVGIYVSAFHSPLVLAAHTAWSLASAVVLAIPLFGVGDAASAVIMILGMVAATVVPPGLQFCFWVLRSDMLADPLTTLLSRRGFEYHSTMVVGGSGSVPVCVIMVDLDRFKAVNDTFGHHAGDQVLVRTAERLQRAAPAHSIVSRLGGEEFAVVARLPVPAAIDAAELLRTAIAEPVGSISVTASVGIAVADAGADGYRRSRELVQDLIRCADSAMYQAKQRGGNTVVVEHITALQGIDTWDATRSA